MLENAKKNGVERIVCIGTDPDDSLAAKEFAKKHENVFWTYGIHPEYSGVEPKNFEPDEKLVAIGEVGLDYHCEKFDRASQIRLFEEMLQLAIDKNLPLSFHVRNAFEEIIMNHARRVSQIDSPTKLQLQELTIEDLCFFSNFAG